MTIDVQRLNDSPFVVNLISTLGRLLPLPLALHTMTIPLTQAVLITLGFRAMTLWLPLVVGTIAFRLLQRQATVK